MDRPELALSGRALLLGAVALPLATFATTFPVAHLQRDNPTGTLLTFLSNTIDYPPSSNIGTFGLVLSLGALLFVMILRHVLLTERLSRASLSLRGAGPSAGSALTAQQIDGVYVGATDRIALARDRQLRAWRCSSERCLAVGCTALLGGLVVCSVQPHANFPVHLSGAGVFFLGSAVLTAWSTALDSRLAGKLPHLLPSQAAALSAFSAVDGPGLRLRRCIAALTALTFLLGFCLGVLMNGQNMLGWAWVGRVLPADQRQQLVFTVGPFVEMALLVLFVLHFLTLLPVFWRLRVRLVMTVQWDDPSSATVQAPYGS